MKNCDRGHSFSPYGPPSRQVTCISTSKHALYCLSSVYHGPAFTDKKVLIKDLGWRMVNVLSFIHQPIWLARKASDCQELIGDIKHTWKIIVILHMCSCGISPSWKSLQNTAAYVIKLFEKKFAVAWQGELKIRSRESRQIAMVQLLIPFRSDSGSFG